MRSCLAALALVALTSWAQAQEPGLESFEIGDLPLESGTVIHDFNIAYRTEGTLNAAKSNVVLMVTAIGGNHHRIDYLIGPGRGLDTDHLFVIKTNAIGNGLTTSPSTSVSQHGPDFPHFTIRDMVESQYRLLRHLGIEHLVAVAGASMGGMQTLQWGVSHPAMMDGLIALTPMARTTAWSIAVNHATRNALMLDPAFQGGHYTAQPEAGWRMRADILQVLATRTPEAMRQQFVDPMDVEAWITAQEDAVVASHADANDWIAQTWAYDRHNVGDTRIDGKPIFDGDPIRALHSIKAKALMMSGTLDLYNPVENGIEAAAAIPDGRHVTIPSVQGHVAAAAGYKPADLAFINATVRGFMQDVTKGWQTTR
ncbi:alpha/beta fold hydrolase [Beijerinckia sp. L45]|uniref:alpha/beta fold hydrolase n=1 Tax=Beijerinckia sp. L45 TaxID=1641855 RepID=UPI00131C0A4D|nr:alpha/beta fold hydrolase [Beijerinckia sp. L45]